MYVRRMKNRLGDGGVGVEVGQSSEEGGLFVTRGGGEARMPVKIFTKYIYVPSNQISASAENTKPPCVYTIQDSPPPSLHPGHSICSCSCPKSVQSFPMSSFRSSNIRHPVPFSSNKASW